MPSYTMDQLDDLEEASAGPSYTQQSAALSIVSQVLERNSITYAVIGGMNFNLRGSDRVTGDIDLVVGNRPRMDALLNVFNDHTSIIRPANRMQWVSGIARVFVRVAPSMVQLDFMPQGAEGFSISSDLATSVERWPVTLGRDRFYCNILTMGPLATAKIKAHYKREKIGDYEDLLFACTSDKYAPLVRASSKTFREEWKTCFLESVKKSNPGQVDRVRWALRMSESSGSSSQTGASSSRGPQDGQKSEDGYWTFSSRDNKWYH